MKPFLFALLAGVCAVGCVGALEAGHYPHGFITGSRMHYWHPRVARVLFGNTPAPVAAPEDHPRPYVWPQPKFRAESVSALPTLYSVTDEAIRPEGPVIVTHDK